MENIDIKLKLSEKKRSKRKEALLALALISPFIIIFIMFTLIPFVMGFVFSFMKYNPYNPGESQFVGITNYANLFNFNLAISKSFWNSFATMLLFDIVAVPCLIILPLFLAYLLNMHPPGYKLFRALIYLPSVVSISIVGIIFGNIFAGDGSGLINALFGTEIKWLSGTPWNGDTLRWVVFLIASIWWQTGTNFIIFSGALRDVPKSLYEACEMDGGGRWMRIIKVTIPNIRMAIAICLFNTLIAYLGLYGQPYVLNDASNRNILVSPMMFIQNYLSDMAFARQTGYICASAIVFGIIVMAFSIVERKISSGKKRRGRHTAECQRYFAQKTLIGKEENIENAQE